MHVIASRRIYVQDIEKSEPREKHQRHDVPLIDAVRSKGKTLPPNLRWTISAIFWRHQNGTEW